MPGSRCDDEQTRFARQTTLGGRGFDGFNTVRGLAPKRDARAQFLSAL
jgi:hypothetical protein